MKLSELEKFLNKVALTHDIEDCDVTVICESDGSEQDIAGVVYEDGRLKLISQFTKDEMSGKVEP